MLGILFVSVALLSGLAGYGIALVTAEPVNLGLLERRRMANEQRLAQLRLHHLTQSALQRLLDEARFNSED